MKKKSQKDKRKVFLASRRGVIMISTIAVLVLLINLITASYSWFTPQNVNGTGLQYTFDGKPRSENCSFKTYKGTKVTDGDRQEGEYLGQIRYDANETTGNVSVAANSVQYFKTEIVNADTQNASDVSLFIKSMPACTVAVTYPANSVRIVSSTTSDYYIIRNAYVKRKDTADVNGPGLLVVEWFVKTGSSIATINLNNLYLTYN